MFIHSIYCAKIVKEIKGKYIFFTFQFEDALSWDDYRLPESKVWHHDYVLRVKLGVYIYFFQAELISPTQKNTVHTVWSQMLLVPIKYQKKKSIANNNNIANSLL